MNLCSQQFASFTLKRVETGMDFEGNRLPPAQAMIWQAGSLDALSECVKAWCAVLKVGDSAFIPFSPFIVKEFEGVIFWLSTTYCDGPIAEDVTAKMKSIMNTTRCIEIATRSLELQAEQWNDRIRQTTEKEERDLMVECVKMPMTFLNYFMQHIPSLLRTANTIQRVRRILQERCPKELQNEELPSWPGWLVVTIWFEWSTSPEAMDNGGAQLAFNHIPTVVRSDDNFLVLYREFVRRAARRIDSDRKADRKSFAIGYTDFILRHRVEALNLSARLEPRSSAFLIEMISLIPFWASIRRSLDEHCPRSMELLQWIYNGIGYFCDQEVPIEYPATLFMAAMVALPLQVRSEPTLDILARLFSKYPGSQWDKYYVPEPSAQEQPTEVLRKYVVQRLAQFLVEPEGLLEMDFCEFEANEHHLTTISKFMLEVALTNVPIHLPDLCRLYKRMYYPYYVTAHRELFVNAFIKSDCANQMMDVREEHCIAVYSTVGNVHGKLQHALTDIMKGQGSPSISGAASVLGFYDYVADRLARARKGSDAAQNLQELMDFIHVSYHKQSRLMADLKFWALQGEQSQRCLNCKKGNCELQTCSRCNYCVYCSRECQEDDWDRHKEGCRKISEVVQRYKDSAKAFLQGPWSTRSCHGCGISALPGVLSDDKEKDPGRKLLRCSRCHEAHYCNPQCQRQHWPEHKLVCVKK